MIRSDGLAPPTVPGPQGSRTLIRARGLETAAAGAGLRAAEDAIVQPLREPGEEPVTSTVVLAFTQPDYQALCRLTRSGDKSRRLWGCAVKPGVWQEAELTLAGPVLGGPWAAMVLEKLIAWGARRVLALGWCGSLAPQVQIGHLVLPTGAAPGDGTSPHYWPEAGAVPPHAGLFGLLAGRLQEVEAPWHAGAVWSTDGFYRETPSLVRRAQAQGMVGIDLELAALLAVGQYRGVAVAGLLVISDELFTGQWRPARGAPPFRRAREAALRVVLDVAATGEHHV